MNRKMGIIFGVCFSVLLTVPVLADDDFEDEIGVALETESMMQESESAEDLAAESEKLKAKEERKSRKMHTQLLKKQEHYDNKRKSAEGQIARDEVAIDKARERISQAKAKIAKMQNESEVLDAKKKRTREKLQNLNQKYKQARAAVNQRQVRLKKVRAEMTKNEKQAVATTQSIEKIKMNLARIHSRLKHSRKKSYAHFKKNAKLIDKFREQLASAEQRLEQLEVKINAQADNVSQ